MKIERFWNWLAKNYDDEVGEETIAITKKHLKEDDAVLDFGCARGAYTVALAGEVRKIAGIDISPRMIEFAQKKSSEIEFRTASIFDVEERYDVILAYNILHLLKEASQSIQKIDELLMPEGRFISVSACLKETLILRIFGFFVSLFHIIQLKRFTVSQLKQMISERFDIVESKNFGPHHILIAAVKREA